MAFGGRTRTAHRVQARRHFRSGTRAPQRPFRGGNPPPHPAPARSPPPHRRKARNRSYSRTTESFLSLNPSPLEKPFLRRALRNTGARRHARKNISPPPGPFWFFLAD